MFQSHHVLAQKFADHPVIRLLGDRFNHDAIRNLIALPSKQRSATELGSSPHTGGHLDSYYKGFCDYLEKLRVSPKYDIASAGDARALDEMASDLEAFVATAKYAVANGHLIPNTPENMTKEEANGVNTKWYSNAEKYAQDNAEPIRQMVETVDQYSNAGQRDAALYLPILSPTSGLSMAERIEIVKRLRKPGSPISLQFTPVGPVPELPGLVPPVVNTRLPGFIPPPLDSLNELEGFAPSNPFLTYGLPGFPVPPQGSQGLTQVPPSVAMPSEPQVLQFHREIGRPLTYLSDGSQVLGPQPNVDQRSALLMGAGVLGTGLMMVPVTRGLGATLLRGAMVGAATEPVLANSNSRDIKPADGSVFSTGAAPYNPFELDRPAPYSARGLSNLFEKAQNPEVVGTSSFADRFGNWIDTTAGIMPTQGPLETPVAPAAGAAAPDEARRLTRANVSNGGSVFTSGSAPVPYLASPDGNWPMPIGESLPLRASRPGGASTEVPSYVIPPPIFGVHDAGNANNDAEEWFSRWVRPFIGPE